MKFILLTFGIILSFSKLSTFECRKRNQYVIPVATIEILQPKGFSVSIPDNDIELFAFHGNLNRPIDDLEAGDYSKDILKAQDGRWTFYDRATILKSGDVLNYWLFVIKNGLGYRKDFQTYTFPEIETSTADQSNEDINALKLKLNTTLKQLNELNGKVNKLQTKVIHLEDVISETILQNASDIGTKLILISSIATNLTDTTQNPVEIIRNVLTNQLNLPEISNSIYSATQTKAGIIFDVSNSEDKIKILIEATKKLRNSGVQILDYIIEEPTNSIVPDIDIRINKKQ